MSVRDIYKKTREDLQRRQEEEGKKKTGGYGQQGSSIYLLDKIPDGIEFFRPKATEEGAKWNFDIIPWFLGDNLNNPKIPPGSQMSYLFVSFHRNIGNMFDKIVCPTRTFGEPCPIDIWLRTNRLPKEQWNAVRSVDYGIYLVYVRDGGEEQEKGLQIYEVPWRWFGEVLKNRSEMPEGGGYIPYWDVELGKTVSIIMTKKGEGKINFDVNNLFDRRKPIPDSVLEQAANFHLDECVNLHPSYEYIYETFFNKKYVEGEDMLELKPIINEYKTDKQEQPKEEKQKPAMTSPQDENDIPDEKYEPVTKECPHGHVIGRDINRFSHCEMCTVWDACLALSNDNKKEAPEDEAPEQKTQRRRRNV